MRCYDCAEAGETEQAVAVCRHCGGGVCPKHVRVTGEEARHVAGMGLSHGLRDARHMTCGVCHDAESTG
ncbi:MULTISPECIES: DUF2180 family protein [unclassified Streptomyces]|uniref:DUF2180 family protein n=1 Tax=Streptomyces sp. SYP-A7185 TaxID=3040076 RepID=UPI0038F7049D